MEYIRLADAFDLRMGKTPSRSNPSYWGENNKWLSISDLSKCGKYVCVTKECITNTAVIECGLKIVPKGTVVMSFKLSIGKTAITSEDMYTNEAIMAFLDKHNYAIDVDYIYHLFCSKDWSLGTNSAVMGATLNKATLSDIYIPLPNLPTQRRIAATLDKVSEGIELCKQMLADLDELVKSQFIEMFGETRTNSKRWKTALLESIASVGSSKRVFVEELKKQGIPFFRGTEVGALATGEKVVPELYITEEHYQVLKEATGVPVIGDLLMPSICPDGRIWMVDTDEPFYFKDGRVLWIHPTDDTIDSCYLLHVLKNTIMTDYGSIASGTTFAELKIFALKALSVMLPPMELQKQFATFLAQADKSKYAVQQQLAELETLKKSLMQEYFGYCERKA